MKTCPECNAELPDRARFCSECGVSQDPLARTSPSAQQATLTGSGAIGQNHGVAAGAYGTAIGRVEGSVYIGPQPRNPVEALAIYRRVVARSCGQLPLRGVDIGAADPTAGQKPLSLTNVYVDLDTTAQTPSSEVGKKQKFIDRADTRPFTALETAIANRQLVLLGNPGGGKSTFVNHLAHCLAMQALEPQSKWLDHLPGWPGTEAGVLPIIVILRDFTRGLPDKLPSRAEPSSLWDFIVERLKAQNLGFAADPIHKALDKGQTLVLLDGLDEVPTVAQRAFVRDAVMAFIRRYPGNRYLITCRVLSYQALYLRLPELPVFELAAFDEKKIDRFITAWYQELAGGVVRLQDADGMTRSLQQAVRRPDLWRLASNPLLLTVMALVHTHRGRLPDARALLYEETVDILLWRWEQVKAGGQDETPRLRQLLLEANRAEADLKRVLWQLAFEAHAKGKAGDDQDKLADIGELKLEKSLAALKDGDRNWAHQVIETMKLRAGLLLERAPEVFTFPHRTFQEYLAGAHLAAQSDFAKQACDRLDKQGMFWREAILLAVGRLVYSLSETARPLELISELCPGQAGDDEVSWHKAWLAGDALLEIGTNRASDSAWGRDLLTRVQGRLVDLVTGGKLTPRERTSAGDTLARLGDPRAGVTTLEGMEFCLVPPGPFWMGERDEEHLNECLNYDYWIGRYPVTQAHFSAFVEAGGYREPRYWREAEVHSVWKNGQVKGWGEDTPHDRPVDYGEPYNLANHPVVGVTWYEALAFTRWLSEQWRDNLPEPWGVHLPTEAEWEKAARGDVDIPAKAIILPAGAIHSRHNLSLAGNPKAKRLYPWGNEPDPNQANYDDSKVNASSAVGCFPGGVGPYGCEEMSGNVWEWCHSLYRSYPYRAGDGREDESSSGSRVLRGGAFNYDADFVRCAFRHSSVPADRDCSFGFRVVVSPFFSER